ncbi:hypothetical protein AMD24_00215 [Candidatus Xiphinematobacter sp. Idaho Grape]|nr:hypothetical protein AMD24_00215 [Candidatus Xiphinematobacter sp. Idaho Grape]
MGCKGPGRVCLGAPHVKLSISGSLYVMVRCFIHRRRRFSFVSTYHID